MVAAIYQSVRRLMSWTIKYFTLGRILPKGIIYFYDTMSDAVWLDLKELGVVYFFHFVFD